MSFQNAQENDIRGILIIQIAGDVIVNSKSHNGISNTGSTQKNCIMNVLTTLRFSVIIL